MENEVKIEDIVKEHGLKGKAPRINWGKDFDDRPLDEKVAYLKKFANSFNEALRMMQDERNLWHKKAVNQEAQAAHMRKQVDQQRGIMQQIVQQENETKRVYQERINALEDKIRKLT